MNYSLGEIDALCRRAARGAGFGWGHAEEAGKAARWLQSHGLPGAECLLRCLEDGDVDVNRRPPDIKGDTWRAPRGSLCPIVTGACLADHAAILATGSIRIGPVRHPLLLVPFAANAALQMQHSLRLGWDKTNIVLSGNTARITGPVAAPQAQTITCETCDPPEDMHPPSHSRADLTSDIYHRLNALAQRTYAPATEASRIAGAGAGLTDND